MRSLITRIRIFSRRHWMPALSGCALLVLWVEPALACTVCTGAEEEATRKAFVGTTALLTFLPMLVMGVMVWLFVRRTLAKERMDEARLLEGMEAER